MTRAAPRFWWRAPGWQAAALAPLGWAYGAVAAHRLDRAPRERMPVPVLCVGNFTVGGTGKTPVAIALVKAAGAMGLRPGVLSRGHGGSGHGVRLVDLARDHAADVGDEPLLIAAHAPVAVGRDRAAGARLLLEKRCDFLVMDDGFQSARIAIDLALLLVDRRFGLGNEFCLPAGPLRAPVTRQLAHAGALLAMGEGEAGAAILSDAEAAGLPVFAATLVPTEPHGLQGRAVLAFAGIGHPEKFFRSVEEAGGDLRRRRSFPDHHPFAAQELDGLLGQARAEKLDLVTTAKDLARLRGTAPPDFLAALRVLEVEARFIPAEAPRRVIQETRANWLRRAGRPALSAGAGPGSAPSRA